MEVRPGGRRQQRGGHDEREPCSEGGRERTAGDGPGEGCQLTKRSDTRVGTHEHFGSHARLSQRSIVRIVERAADGEDHPEDSGREADVASDENHVARSRDARREARQDLHAREAAQRWMRRDHSDARAGLRDPAVHRTGIGKRRAHRRFPNATDEGRRNDVTERIDHERGDRAERLVQPPSERERRDFGDAGRGRHLGVARGQLGASQALGHPRRARKFEGDRPRARHRRSA